MATFKNYYVELTERYIGDNFFDDWMIDYLYEDGESARDFAKKIFNRYIEKIPSDMSFNDFYNVSQDIVEDAISKKKTHEQE